MKGWVRDKVNAIRADLGKVHKSATIWFNGLIGSAIVVLPLAEEQLPQLRDYLPPSFYHLIMVVVIAGNIILRFKTNGALADK